VVVIPQYCTVGLSLLSRIGNRCNCKIADIVIDGNAISCSQGMKYLGVYILANKVFKCDPVTLIMLR